MSQAQQAKFVTLFAPTTLNTGDKVNGRLDATGYDYAELILMIGDTNNAFDVGLWEGEDENGDPAAAHPGATFTIAASSAGKTCAFHVVQPSISCDTPLWLVIDNTTGGQLTVAGLGRLTDGPMVEDLGLAKVCTINGDNIDFVGSG